MATALSNIKVVLQNTIEAVDLQVTDNSFTPTAVTELKLSILDMGGNVVWSDDYFRADGTLTKIIAQPNVFGSYYYPFGSVVGQTSSFGSYIFQWYVNTATAVVPTTIVQNVVVIPPILMYQLPYLRLMIDKSRKVVDPGHDVFLGYTDAQLIMFFESGMQIINGYQPESAVFTTFNFPWNTYRHIALETALMAGVLSQQLFAIDTDIPNYTDQGVSLVIQHQPALAALLTQITARLDNAIPRMKLQFVSTGSIHINQGPNFKLGALISASPTGSLFRNLFIRS
jgi:hypothetical protein